MNRVKEVVPVEILKNPISWFMNTGRSNQAVVIILIIFVLFFIYKIIKKMIAAKKGGGGTGKRWSWIGTPWKIFGTMFSLGAILVICYGFYLLFCYCRPTPEKLAFRELSKNLAENELKPEKKKLATLNEKVKKGEILTGKEKIEAMEADKKIEKVRKDYSDGKLAPLPKPVSVKPKKETWIFAWRATDELMAENPCQKPDSEYVASDVTYSEKELSFVCFKGSKKEDKIVLTRDNQEENYMGYLFNKEKEEYTRIWLYPDNNNFKGHIFANDGAKILATLKRQNHL